MYNTTEIAYSATRINPKTGKVGYPVTIAIKGDYKASNLPIAIAKLNHIMATDPATMAKSEGKTIEQLGWGVSARRLVWGQGARLVSTSNFSVLIPIKE